GGRVRAADPARARWADRRGRARPSQAPERWRGLAPRRGCSGEAGRAPSIVGRWGDRNARALPSRFLSRLLALAARELGEGEAESLLGLLKRGPAHEAGH